jgi:phosphoenolpyruvate carboxykinase (ATP)
VLPPISKLTHEQAVDQFLLGYTARVAGTEAGVTQPEATFSTCFGAPFMPLPPQRYAALLQQKLEKHQPQVWLVNTGWSSGPAGTAPRMKLRYTRAMLTAALEGVLERVPHHPDPIFGLPIPEHCPEVPSDILQPRQTWSNPQKYDAAAQRLAGLFAENLRKYDRKV